MHSRIYEVSTSPIPMHDRFTDKKLYKAIDEGYFTRFFDYAVTITNPAQRNEEIKWLIDYLNTFQNIKGQMVVCERIKDNYFKGKYETFKKHAQLLANASYLDFKSPDIYGIDTVDCNLYCLKEAFNDTSGFYIWDRQEDEDCKLKTLASFLRSQKFRPHGSRTYWIGGVLDYHC